MDFDVFIHGHFCNNHASCFTVKNTHHSCSIYFNAFEMDWEDSAEGEGLVLMCSDDVGSSH